MNFTLKAFNLKTFSLCGLAAIALLAAPLSAVQSAQAEDGGRRGSRVERMAEHLDLTDAQTAELEAIHTDARAQVQSLLTAEQQTALEASEHQGRRALRALDLSEDQRTQMRAIREAAREQVEGVLTAEQREQLAEHREQRQGERGARGEGRRDR